MHHQFSPRVLCGGVCGILRACRHCHYSTRTSCRVSVDQSPSSGFVRLAAIVSLRGISSCVMIASTRKGVRARTKAQGIRFSNCGFTAIYLAVSPAPVIAVGRGRSFLVSEYPLPGIICHLRLAGDVRFFCNIIYISNVTRHHGITYLARAVPPRCAEKHVQLAARLGYRPMLHSAAAGASVLRPTSRRGDVSQRQCGPGFNVAKTSSSNSGITYHSH